MRITKRLQKMVDRLPPPLQEIYWELEHAQRMLFDAQVTILHKHKVLYQEMQKLSNPTSGRTSTTSSPASPEQARPTRSASGCIARRRARAS